MKTLRWKAFCYPRYPISWAKVRTRTTASFRIQTTPTLLKHEITTVQASLDLSKLCYYAINHSTALIKH